MINYGVLLNNLRSDFARQAVMNGNFDIWQRGTSATLADVTLTFLADRWFDYVSKDGGTLPTLTRSRQILTAGELPSAFYFTRLATNGAGSSLGVSSNHRFGIGIEHGTRYLCGAGKKVTISFWARSSIANKKLGIYLRQNYGTGGSPTATEIINGTNWTLTSSWVKYEHTFETNTLSGKTFGTDLNDKLSPEFQYIWGTTTDQYVGATTAETYVGSGNIDIAQVQLNAGSVALPFYPKSFEQEYLACLRYYQKSFPYNTTPADALNYSGSANRVTDRAGSYQGFEIVLSPKMRTSPTSVAIYSPYIATANRIVDVNNTANNYSAYTRNVSENGFSIESSSSMPLITLLCVHWTADAEI